MHFSQLPVFVVLPPIPGQDLWSLLRRGPRRPRPPRHIDRCRSCGKMLTSLKSEYGVAPSLNQSRDKLRQQGTVSSRWKSLRVMPTTNSTCPNLKRRKIAVLGSRSVGSRPLSSVTFSPCADLTCSLHPWLFITCIGSSVADLLVWSWSLRELIICTVTRQVLAGETVHWGVYFPLRRSLFY